MAEIFNFTGETKADIPVENVLEGAKDLSVCIVLGYTKDGQQYFASSIGSIAECNLLVDE